MGMQRRQWVQTLACIAFAKLLPQNSWAGRQAEEALADSVRTALSQALRDDAALPGQSDPAWLSRQQPRLLAHLQQRRAAVLRDELASESLRMAFLQTVWYESSRAGLEPELVLGLIEVESGFRKFAISSADARGYMQVMPFWVRWIGDADEAKLFQPATNLRYGCVILRHYLRVERGDLFLALGRYNGSRGQDRYPSAVLAARQRWRAE
ncbi:MAG: lytic transglycosylase domain-containing protein [Limnohabitans sp.]|jgi:soluble lytic murein transglycosylase-like protein|nr:lytic transglycosylase domain-containing protein [Limnohabitans sp.]